MPETPRLGQPREALTRFEQAVAITLAYEGEDSDHPQDTGGRTRFGIAQRWHPDVVVAELSRAEAIDLLDRRYWFPIRGDLLPWPLAAAVFDHAVHSGPGSAAIALQRAVGVARDGIIGAQTLAAVAARPQPGVLAQVLELRVRELLREGKGAFIVGWMARVANLALVCGLELGALEGRRAA